MKTFLDRCAYSLSNPPKPRVKRGARFSTKQTLSFSSSKAHQRGEVDTTARELLNLRGVVRSIRSIQKIQPGPGEDASVLVGPPTHSLNIWDEDAKAGWNAFGDT